MRPRFFAYLSLALAALMLNAPQKASASDHERTFGVKTGYISRNQSAVAGLFFQYRFSEHFRLAPEASLAFRSNDKDGFLIDVNCHFPIAKSGIMEFYPLAGLNYSSWSQHQTFDEQVGSKDVTNRVSRFGLNLGGGMDFKITSTLKVKLELDYTLVKANSAFRATVGIGYNF
jgi:outer membrane protein X